MNNGNYLEVITNFNKLIHRGNNMNYQNQLKKTQTRFFAIVGVAMLSSLFFTNPSLAMGGIAGGGGHAISCKDKILFLDTFESGVKYGNQISDRSGTMPDRLSAVLNKVNLNLPVPYARMIQEAVTYVTSQSYSKFLNPGLIIAPGLDFGNESGVVMPQNCHLTAVGYYNSSGVLEISKSTYDQLSSTDQAAFWFHEAVYKLARDLGRVSDSIRVRKFVGYLFADNTTKEIINLYFKEMIWQYPWGQTIIVSKQQQQQNELKLAIYNDFKIPLKIEFELKNDLGQVLQKQIIGDNYLNSIDLSKKPNSITIQRTNSTTQGELAWGFISNESRNFDRFSFSNPETTAYFFYQ